MSSNRERTSPTTTPCDRRASDSQSSSKAASIPADMASVPNSPSRQRRCSEPSLGGVLRGQGYQSPRCTTGFSTPTGARQSPSSGAGNRFGSARVIIHGSPTATSVAAPGSRTASMRRDRSNLQESERARRVSSPPPVCCESPSPIRSSRTVRSKEPIKADGRPVAFVTKACVAKAPDQLSVPKGVSVEVLAWGTQWASCRASGGQTGLVPTAHLQERPRLSIDGAASQEKAFAPRGPPTPTCSASRTGSSSPVVVRRTAGSNAVPRQHQAVNEGHGSSTPRRIVTISSRGVHVADEINLPSLGNAAAASDSLVHQASPAPPEQWSSKFEGTMILHTLTNAMRLAHYLLQLLIGGYGTVSALHIACWEGSVGAVAAVTHGSNRIVKDWHSRPGELSPLHIATLCGHVGVVEFLLQLDADPNVPTVHGLRALHISASHEISEALISGRANPRAETSDGDTPLHFACCYQQVSIIELLLSAASTSTGVSGSSTPTGATPRSRLDSLDCANGLASVANAFGVTPLHVAVAHAALEGTSVPDAYVVLLLVCRSADPAAKDQHGKTPADIAKMAGLPSSVALAEFLQGAPEWTPMSGGEDLQTSVRKAACDLLRRHSTELDDAESPPNPQVQLFVATPPKASETFCREEWLVEENARLESEVARLKRELEECSTGHNMLKEMLGSSQDRKSSERNRDAPAYRGDSSCETQSVDEEKRRLREEGEALRRQLEAERGERGQLRQQLVETELARNAAADALRRAVEQQTAVAKQCFAAPKDIDLSEIDTAFSDKSLEVLIPDVDLDRSAVELAHKAEELAAIESEKIRQAAVDAARVEAARYVATRRDSELEAVRVDKQRLETELQKAKKERDQARLWYSELSAQHSGLREEHSILRGALQRNESDARAREATLTSEAREQELLAGRLRDDLGELARRMGELERERVVVQPLQQRIAELRTAFLQEQTLRKLYHNELQDLKGAVRVYARVRPLVAREAGENVAVRKLDAFRLELEQGSDKQGRPRCAKTFAFDSIFDASSTQLDVFSECRGLVSSAVDGFNVTIFAYGQTGAGKTHTMYGGEDSPGLVPRIAEELFEVLGRYDHENEACVRCSMFELYRDDLLDLLLPKAWAKSVPALEIKKDSRGSIFVENCVERVVTCRDELLRTMCEGMERRHTAGTKMNVDSSRSHLIFIVSIESTNRTTRQVSAGKLTLCDLAGSERLKKSEAVGQTMKETQSVNKSLTALGDVIEALTKNAKHVPYRNHKLTQLLSDSLGGNAKTLMIVNCSPAAGNVEETNSSLSYAARAKLIVNKVERNQDSQEVARLKKVVQLLSRELEQARASNGGSVGRVPPGTALKLNNVEREDEATEIAKQLG